MSAEEISLLPDGEKWKRIYSLPSKPKDERLEICFTGFGKSEREELEEIARRNNLKVVQSVTKNLSFLCCGSNAGEEKIKKAGTQNVAILDKKKFLCRYSERT